MGAAICKLQGDPVVPVREAPHHGRSAVFCRAMMSLRRGRACAKKENIHFQTLYRQPLGEVYSFSKGEQAIFCACLFFPNSPGLTGLGSNRLLHLHLVMGKSSSHMGPL